MEAGIERAPVDRLTLAARHNSLCLGGRFLGTRILRNASWTGRPRSVASQWSLQCQVRLVNDLRVRAESLVYCLHWRAAIYRALIILLQAAVQIAAYSSWTTSDSSGNDLAIYITSFEDSFRGSVAELGDTWLTLIGLCGSRGFVDHLRSALSFWWCSIILRAVSITVLGTRAVPAFGSWRQSLLFEPSRPCGDWHPAEH